MKVKIVRCIDNESIEAKIMSPANVILPSITDGWRFNFKKHAKKKQFQTYILVATTTPDEIEGCLIFQLKDTVEPYMAYIEIAPHNKGTEKRYEKVAGCLIAYACRLSFISGKNHFKGWLAFDVMEENKDDEIKLMALYSQKYAAMKWGETTMVLSPEAGENLINKYLN
ncbi:hypothetical protein [Emticicia agri]|uniref:N-acetyltransferase n=1 Tax=Emticicia agri TaxID=2492393 RepID=A0A4Q5LVB6_9BACT|nr:hypothetical protein [Emticicia agri]RYU93447.1 hypothetical protein EWM59_22125 [Emticicia agri]